ncbi:unnamed protein product [Leptosia nina]|uniref:Uncharacterized protein n=1 Tax=Leptosia nina TaxID=320188 RepID=A0AAV1JXP5_9NEOP
MFIQIFHPAVVGLCHKATTKDIKAYSDNEDLINFIDLLNSPDDDLHTKNGGRSKYLEDAGMNSREAQDRTELMRLLQKNYDAREFQGRQEKERLYFIENPEIIDDYRDIRRSQEMQYDADFEEKTLKRLLKTLRRNAVFRLKKDKTVKANLPALRLGIKMGSLEEAKKAFKPLEKEVITKKYNWDRSVEKKYHAERPKIRPRPRDETFRRPKERSYGFVILVQSRGRKYDVEFEARKIYGQDLAAVLERFRRTPDYIQILTDELEKVWQNLRVVMAQNLFYYSNKLKARVNEVISENTTNARLRMRTTTGEYYTKYIGFFRKPMVRQHTHNMSGAERLELYFKLDPALPLQVRNRMVDLSFEHCGYVIHATIKSLVAGGSSMSTLQQDTNTKYQTHYSHKITSTSKDKTSTSPDKSLRNFKQSIQM